MKLSEINKFFDDELDSLSQTASKPRITSTDAPNIRNTSGINASGMNPEEMLQKKYSIPDETIDVDRQLKLQERVRENTKDFYMDEGFLSGLANSFKKGRINNEFNRQIADAKAAEDDEAIKEIIRARDTYNNYTASLLEQGDPNAVEKAFYQASETMPYMIKIGAAQVGSHVGGRIVSKVGMNTVAKKQGMRNFLAAFNPKYKQFLKANKLQALDKPLNKALKKALTRYAVSDAVLTPMQAGAAATGAGVPVAAAAEVMQNIVIGGMFLYDAIQIAGALSKNEETDLYEMKKSPFLVSKYGAAAYAVQKEMAGAHIADQVRQGIPMEYISKDAATAVAYLQGGIESLFNPFSPAIRGTGAVINKGIGKMFTSASAAQGSKSLSKLNILLQTGVVTAQRTVQEMSEEGAQAIAGQYYISQTARSYLEKNPEAATNAALYSNMASLRDYTARDYIDDFVDNAKAAGPVSLIFAAIGLPGSAMNIIRTDQIDRSLINDAQVTAEAQTEGLDLPELTQLKEEIEERNMENPYEDWDYQDIVTYRQTAVSIRDKATVSGNQVAVDEADSIIKSLDRADLMGDMLSYFKSNYMTQDEIDSILIPDSVVKQNRINKNQIDTILDEVIENRKAQGKREVTREDYYELVFGPKHTFFDGQTQQEQMDARVEQEKALNDFKQAIENGTATPSQKKALYDLVKDTIPDLPPSISNEDLVTAIETYFTQLDTQQQEQQQEQQAKEIPQQEFDEIRSLINIEDEAELEQITLEEFRENYYDQLPQETRSRINIERAFELATGREVKESSRTRGLEVSEFVKNARIIPLTNTEVKELSKDREGRSILQEIYGTDAVKVFMTAKEAEKSVLSFINKGFAEQETQRQQETPQEPEVTVEVEDAEATQQVAQEAEQQPAPEITTLEAQKKVLQEELNDIEDKGSEEAVAIEKQIVEIDSQIQNVQAAPESKKTPVQTKKVKIPKGKNVLPNETPRQKNNRTTRELKRVIERTPEAGELIGDNETVKNASKIIANLTGRDIATEGLRQGEAIFQGGQVANVTGENMATTGVPAEFFDENGRIKSSVESRFVFVAGKKQVFSSPVSRENAGYSQDLIALQLFDKETGAAYNVLVTTTKPREDGKNFLGYVDAQGIAKSNALGYQNPNQYVTFSMEEVNARVSEILMQSDVFGRKDALKQEKKVNARLQKKIQKATGDELASLKEQLKVSNERIKTLSLDSTLLRDNQGRTLTIAEMASQIWGNTGGIKKYYEDIVGGQDLFMGNIPASVQVASGLDGNAVSLLSQAIRNDYLKLIQTGTESDLLYLIRTGTPRKQIVQPSDQQANDVKASVSEMVIISRAIKKQASIVLSQQGPRKQVDRALSYLRSVNQDKRKDIARELKRLLDDSETFIPPKKTRGGRRKDQDIESLLHKDVLYQLMSAMADGYGFIKRDMDAFMGEDITVRKNTAIYAAMQNIIKVLESDASANATDIAAIEAIFEREMTEVEEVSGDISLNKFRELVKKNPKYVRPGNFRATDFRINKKDGKYVISTNYNLEAVELLRGTFKENNEQLDLALKHIFINNRLEKERSAETPDIELIAYLESERSKIDNKIDSSFIFSVERAIAAYKKEANIISIERKALNIVLREILDPNNPYVRREDTGFVGDMGDRDGSVDPIADTRENQPFATIEVEDDVTQAALPRDFILASAYADRFISGIQEIQTSIEALDQEKQSYQEIIRRRTNEKRRGVKLEKTSEIELANAKEQVKLINKKIDRLNKQVDQLPTSIQQAEAALRILEKEKPLSLKNTEQMSAIERELQSIGDPRLKITQQEINEHNEARQQKIELLKQAIAIRKEFANEQKPVQNKKEETKFYSAREAEKTAEVAKLQAVYSLLEKYKMENTRLYSLAKSIHDAIGGKYDKASIQKGKEILSRELNSIKEQRSAMFKKAKAEAKRKGLDTTNIENIKIFYPKVKDAKTGREVVEFSILQQKIQDLELQIRFLSTVDGSYGVRKLPDSEDGKDVYVVKRGQSAAYQEYMMGEVLTQEQFDRQIKIEANRFGFTYRAEPDGYILTAKNGKSLKISYYADGILDPANEGRKVAGVTQGDIISIAGMGANIGTVQHELAEWSYEALLTPSEQAEIIRVYRSAHEWANAMQDYQPATSSRRTNIINNKVSNFWRSTLGLPTRTVDQASHIVQQDHQISKLYKSGALHERNPDYRYTTRRQNPLVPTEAELKTMTRTQLQSAFRTKKALLESVGINLKATETMSNSKLIEHVARTDHYLAYALASMARTQQGRQAIKTMTNAVVSMNLSPESRLEIIAQYDQTGVIKQLIDEIKYSEANIAAPTEQRLLQHMSGMMPAVEGNKVHEVTLGGKKYNITGDNLISLVLASRNEHTKKAMMSNRSIITVKDSSGRMREVGVGPFTEADIQGLYGRVGNEAGIIKAWQNYTNDASKAAGTLFNDIASKEGNYLGVKQGEKWVHEDNWFPTMWQKPYLKGNLMGAREGEAESWMFAKRDTPQAGVLIIPDISQVVGMHAVSVANFVGKGDVFQQLHELAGGPRGTGTFVKDTAFNEWDPVLAGKFNEQFTRMMSQVYGKNDKSSFEQEITRHPLFKRVKEGQDIYRLSSPTTFLKMASSAHLVAPLLNQPGNAALAFTTSKHSDKFNKAFEANTYQFVRGMKSVVADVGDTTTSVKGKTVLRGETTVFDTLRAIPNAADRMAMKNIFLSAAYDELPANMPRTMASVDKMLDDIDFVRRVNEKANKLTMETQPSYETFMRSDFINRGSIFSFIFGRYGTQRNKMMNMLAKAYIKMKTDDSPETRRQFQKVAFSIFGTNALILASISTGNVIFRETMADVFFGGDDDEKRFPFEKKEKSKAQRYSAEFLKNIGLTQLTTLEFADEGVTMAVSAYGAIVGRDDLTQRAFKQNLLASEVTAIFNVLNAGAKMAIATQKMEEATSYNRYMQSKRSYAYQAGRLYSNMEQLIGVTLRLPTRMLATTVQSREVVRELFFED